MEKPLYLERDTNSFGIYLDYRWNNKKKLITKTKPGNTNQINSTFPRGLSSAVRKNTQH